MEQAELIINAHVLIHAAELAVKADNPTAADIELGNLHGLLTAELEDSKAKPAPWPGHGQK